jgi:hypothetical protein
VSVILISMPIKWHKEFVFLLRKKREIGLFLKICPIIFWGTRKKVEGGNGVQEAAAEKSDDSGRRLRRRASIAVTSPPMSMPTDQ